MPRCACRCQPDELVAAAAAAGAGGAAGRGGGGVGAPHMPLLRRQTEPSIEERMSRWGRTGEGGGLINETAEGGGGRVGTVM